MRRVLGAILICGCGGPVGPVFGEDTDAVVDTDVVDTDVVVDDVDLDADGVLAPVDCDDRDARVHPFAPERCNRRDDDCDDVVDEAATPLAAAGWFGPLYRDVDGDGFGADVTETWFCEDPGDGWVAEPGDCDEADADVSPEGATTCPAVTPVCGNGSVEPGEHCDDGDREDGDGCSADCAREACGDGTRQAGRSEACDDGNLVDGDGCDAACRVEDCGDGLVQPALGEACDDGNRVDGDGCSVGCAPETCGDGALDAANGEACDDAGVADGDGCSSICRLEGCGDGDVDEGETCDDGNADDGDGCASTCHLERFRLVPVRATVDPIEETSGITWDYLDPDKPADPFVTGKVDGILVMRTSVVLNDNTPRWAGAFAVDVAPGQSLELRLADFDATTEPDVIGAWFVDQPTLDAHVGGTLRLDGSMVDELAIEVHAPW